VAPLWATGQLLTGCNYAYAACASICVAGYFEVFRVFEDPRAATVCLEVCALTETRFRFEIHTHNPYGIPMTGPNKLRSWRHRALHRQLIMDDGVSGESSYRVEPPMWRPFPGTQGTLAHMCVHAKRNMYLSLNGLFGLFLSLRCCC